MIVTESFRIQEKEFRPMEIRPDLESFEVRSVSRNYRVVWDSDSNPGARLLSALDKNPRNLLLLDKRVFQLYQTGIKLAPERIFLAEATEDFKTLTGVAQVIEFLQRHNFTKGETLAVCGGGIIQDVGAFAAACFKRGIPWIYFPTTLLSMCDSCIGGKTGINHGGAKNQLALFSAPSQVVINARFLDTLGPNEVRSGLGEILKLCITGGPDWIERFRQNVRQGVPAGPSSLKELILCGLLVKKAVVEEDEFELDHRRSLNYGHTLGHAVEALSHYQIPHGEAVSVGMLAVNEFSVRRGFLIEKDNAPLQSLILETLSERTKDKMRQLNVRDILSLLQKDKKALSNSLLLVLIRAPGDTFFYKTDLNAPLVCELDDIVRSLF